MAYKPIESYGVIGDMHSVALVGHDGSIDWCCLPYFDSPSIFAAILDEHKGGYFQIAATHKGTLRQMYLPETNVLLTRFLSHEGVGEVIDFMPVRHQYQGQHEARFHQIVRVAQAVRGSVSFRMRCYPAYDFARQKHELTINGRGAVFEVSGAKFGLISPYPLTRQNDGVEVDFCLDQGEKATFVFRHDSGGCGNEFLEAMLDGEDAQRHTVQYWRGWHSHNKYEGRWREMVDRSALVLKLLTFEPTGAMVAAPTCSLPEEIGGVRNWDYRYTWIRDAAFTTYAFMRLGYTEEAANFMNWLHDRVREEETPTGPLQIMYTIHGGHELPEQTLGSPRGLLWIAPGARRQRRLRAASARYLWRAHRLDLSVRQARHADRLRLLEPDPRHARLGGQQLGTARRRHLGGSRRQAAVRLFQDAVLGGARPWSAAGPEAQLADRPPASQARARSHLRNDHAARDGTKSARPSCSISAPTRSTPATC